MLLALNEEWCADQSSPKICYTPTRQPKKQAIQKSRHMWRQSHCFRLNDLVYHRLPSNGWSIIIKINNSRLSDDCFHGPDAFFSISDSFVH